MPQKLETVLKHVEEINNDVNRQLIKDYHMYLISRDTSTSYQKDNIKLIHMFAKFIENSKTLHDIKDQETIVAFLDRIAALKLNRKFIGIEKDSETFKMAKMQLEIFTFE
jgi:flagellar biosynthesis regulator FlbT